MARRNTLSGSRGFSLVELMVALLFTLILMAGMAAVFKSTLQSFSGTGEKLSSARRNRMSIDLLYDDLNNAGMYLRDLSMPPPDISFTNEAFQIFPNPTALAGVTQGADELYFYMDEPLPFEATLYKTEARNNDILVGTTSAPGAKDNTYEIDCKDPTYAGQVKAGQIVLFKDSWDQGYIQSASASGDHTTVVLAADPAVAISGSGYSGYPRFSHLQKGALTDGSGIVFVKPAQMVRYSIQLLNLDPASGTASTPCLVRDQGTYSPTGFTPAVGAQQVVTENISGFRVFLSANAGTSWVGGVGYADWAAIKTALNDQLAASGRSGFTAIPAADPSWIRSIPLLVRVDVTTRTAIRRAEFSSTGASLAYKEQVQSLIMVPRHFGLSMK